MVCTQNASSISISKGFCGMNVGNILIADDYLIIGGGGLLERTR